MSRITESLKKQVEQLNALVLSKEIPVRFNLDFAYGGVKLETSEHRDVFYSGYTTKSKLSDLIDAFYKGIALRSTF